MLKATLAVLGAAVVLAVVSSTQLMAQTNGTYQANYFLGLHQPGNHPGNDASITILDPGSNGRANLCADIYVLNPSKELEACCGCFMTPDEIIHGSVVNKLLSNNISPIWLSNGVIKIISSAESFGGCNAAAPKATATLRAWLTRVDKAFTGSTAVTTTQFAAAPLSAAEENFLATRCGDILLVGSGYGSCSCPSEPPNHPAGG